MTDAVITTPVGAATIAASASATAASATASTVPSKRRRFRRRHLWLVPGLAIAIYANELGKHEGLGILELIALGVTFGIAPHVPLLLRYLGGSRTNGPASLAIPLFNFLHQPMVAAASVAVATVGVVGGLLPMIVLVATLVWASHIVIGWGLGDVIRHPEAQR
jgi:hypothetical protein